MDAAKDTFTKVLDEYAKRTKSKTGFMGLLSDNTITLKNLLLSAVVVGLELLLSSQVFDCPLENHALYGTVFLVIPFFIVFITNVLLIADVWRVTDRTCIGRYRRCCEFGFWVLPNIVKAFVGPCVWLIASFADTDYYVCAEVGQDIEKRNLTNTTIIKELEAKFADAKSTSHMLAWLFFAIMVAVTFVVMTTKKCCLKDNVLVGGDYVLERREAIAALIKFRHFIDCPREKGEESNKGAGAGTGDSPAGLPVPNPSAEADASGAAAGVSASGPSAGAGESGAAAGVSTSGPSAGAGASGTAAGVSASGPSAEAGATEVAAGVSTPGPRADSALGPGVDTPDAIVPVIPKETGEGSGEDKGENKDKTKFKGITSRYMGKEEEITLYPNGIPEQCGRKKVEDLFKALSNEGSWTYGAALNRFQKMYPRVVTGRPWDPWVSIEEEAKSKKDSQYSRVTTDGEEMEMDSSV